MFTLVLSGLMCTTLPVSVRGNSHHAGIMQKKSQELTLSKESL